MSEQHEGGMREGVRHVEVDEEHAGQRLDNFLMRQLASVPRSRIYRLVRRGEVRVNGRRASPEHRLQSHDSVRIPPVTVQPQTSAGRIPSRLLEAIEQSIVQEDDRLIVINKPAGIAVHGGSGVSFGVIEALRALKSGESLELVHRLDRDTSGCLLIARKPSALRTLHALLREGQFEKGYLALVKGKWNLGRKRIDVPLRTDLRVGGERTVKAHASGKEAVSDFRPVQFFGNRASLLEVAIQTGRTHQIRVHAAYTGHPVAGDEKYGDEAFNAEMKESAGLDRMFLHAHSVSFTWPAGAGQDRSHPAERVEGSEFSVNTPLPPELGAVLDRLSRSREAKGRSRRGR